ncbi:MAG TPA: hypothetical protein DD979_13825 [Gammaproteobacteria bacterium]|nr:hypothetical protein [Gammaproteobacteria bacterium]
MTSFSKILFTSSILCTGFALASPNYLAQVGLPDTDGNGTAEIATLYIDRASQRTYVLIRDALTDAAVKRISFFSENFEPYDVSTMPDINGNGIP